MRCLTLPPTTVRTRTTSCIVCGCGWSTPELNDLTTARQAHAAHVAERRERARMCSWSGLHDAGPDKRCRDCGVLLDDSLVCRPEPYGPPIV